MVLDGPDRIESGFVGDAGDVEFFGEDLADLTGQRAWATGFALFLSSPGLSQSL